MKPLLPAKRWSYACLTHPEFFLSLAIVDLGYAASCFVHFLAPGESSLLRDISFLGVPGLTARVNLQGGAGASAYFRDPRGQLEIERPSGTHTYRVAVQSGDLQVFALLKSEDALALDVSGSYDANRWVRTQKRALMPCEGFVRCASSSWDLRQARGGLDHSAGHLPRHTQWHWAFMPAATGGETLAFNLHQGNNLAGANENCLWFGAQPQRLAPVYFEWQNGTRVQSADGSVDLRFEELSRHQEKRDLLLVRSDFEQRFGYFSGSVQSEGRRLVIERSLGVLERQSTLW